MRTMSGGAISFRWPGGKAKLAGEIISHLPKSGRKFIDLFAGRANIILRAIESGYQYEEWIANDIGTFKFLNALKTHGRTFRVQRDKSPQEFDHLKYLAHRDDPYALIIEIGRASCRERV